MENVMCWYIKFRKDLYPKDAYNPETILNIFNAFFSQRPHQAYHGYLIYITTLGG